MDKMDNWKNATKKQIINEITALSNDFNIEINIDLEKTKNDKASLVQEYQRILSYGLDNFLFFLI